MGYSHYWRINFDHPEWRPGFARLQLDTKPIILYCQGQGIELVRVEYKWRNGKLVTRKRSDRPTLGEGEIMFNGWPPGEEDGGAEDFWLNVKENEEHSCKTYRRPYDLAVSTVLLRARALMPGVITLGSDGDWDHEWLRGAEAWIGSKNADGIGARKLYEQIFGPLPEGFNPLAEEEVEV
jgi:hypothetical protein